MKKAISIALAVLMIISVMPFAVLANATTISDKASFKVSVTQVEKDAKEFAGCLKVQISCKTDGTTPVTTIGCTVVVNTNTIDTIDIDTEEVTTSSYLSQASQFGSKMAVEALEFGSGKRKSSFSGFESLGMCSYNSSSKELYMFVCGMQPGGVKIPAEETPIANLYLKIKSGKKLDESSIRLMKLSEFENTDKCPSKSIYPGEISSTSEAAAVCKNLSLSVDKALIGQSNGETTTAKTESTTKPLSASEVETQLKEEIKNPITPASEDDKSSSAYIAYQTALAKAELIMKNPSSSDEQKREVLKEVQKTKEAYVNGDNGTTDGKSADTSEKENSLVWLYVVIAVAVVAVVAVVIVVVSAKKKKKESAE